MDNRLPASLRGRVIMWKGDDMDDPKKEIGRRIKRYRKARHMTQRKLAEKIGCAEITIRQYESGRYEPRLVLRRAIADALNVPYGNLFDIELIDEGKDRMKTISGIEFASEHNGTDVFRVIELAYEQGWKDGHSEQLSTNLAELGTDCISRQAVITQLSHNKNKGDDEWELAVENDIQTVWQLPPIQPKRGRWIYKNDLITAPTGYWECSECKEGRLLYEENFCPNCGADMRGEQDE